MQHAGGCHCGNLRYVLATQLALTELPLRACQCTFCRAHGALSTSDPKGSVQFTFKDEGQLTRYRFGQRTADFLICGVCGIYIGAEMEHDGRRYAIINTNTLDEAAKVTQDLAPMHYDKETSGERIARRAARWTPVA